MAEQTVTLQPGESKLVSFEAIPHEPRTYQVSVDGLTGSFRATPATILLWWGRIGGYPPAYGVVVWDAKIYDLNAKTWLMGSPSGIKDVNIASEFKPSSLRFLIMVEEWHPGGPMVWSPLCEVEVPSYGEYAWTGGPLPPYGRLDGATYFKSLERIGAEVIATLTSWPSSSEPGPYMWKMRIDEIISGDPEVLYVPVSKYVGGLPVDAGENILVGPGDRVRATIRLEGLLWMTSGLYKL